MRLLIAVVAAALLAGADDGAAATRRQCKRACVERVAAECRGFGKAFRRCRKGILSLCRRSSVEACFLTPGTTTSTTLGTGTTVTVTTMTTTTTRATTTSTTARFAYAGLWFFSGTLAEDTCGVADFFLDALVDVTHAPGSPVVSVQIGVAPVMTGTADATGFEAGEAHVGTGGCLVTSAIVAERTADPARMLAGIGIDVTCAGDACRAIWTGDLER